MKRNAEQGLEAGLAIGGAIKGIAMIGLEVAVIGSAIYLATQGSWGTAALVFFIGAPIAVFVADIVTGVLVAILGGLGLAVGAAVGEGDDERR